MDPEFVKKVVMQIGKTQEEEYSCDEVFALLDQYVELVVTGEDAAAMMPLVLNHLEMCRDCFEEYEVLLDIVRKMSV